MRRHPTSILVAALSLGLSIGAVGAIFSLVDAVLLRPLPVVAPDRLVLLGEQAGDRQGLSWSVTQFRTFTQSPALSGVCAFRPRTAFSVTRDGQADVATGQLLSGGCYNLLGLRPQLGRLFTDDDERAGDANPVAVISDGFWRRQFAADPSVIGRPLELRGHTVMIIGVTPPAFYGLEPGRTVDISLPLSLQPWAFPGRLLSASNVRWLRLLGRLTPGISHESAAAELAGQWAQSAAPSTGSGSAARFVLLDGGQGLSDLRTQFARPLRLLFGAVGLLLLLACANLASLTLARNHVRASEVTLRLALGASRSRVVRQLFTESLTLSLAAGGAGLALAYWASHAVVTLLSRGRTPIILGVGLDARVVLFTMLMSLVAGVLFGLWPAVRATRAGLQAGLQAQTRTLTGSRRGHWSTLIAVQTALSVVLIITAALFARSLARLYSADIGVDKRQVMLVSIGPGLPGGRNGAAVAADFADRMSGTAGVEAVSTAMDVPLGGSSYRAGIAVPGVATNADETVSFDFVGARFFEAMGIPLLAGRDIAATDDAQHPAVGVISQSLALRYFAGTNPIGRHLRGDVADIEVVGIVKDVPYEGLRTERELMLYRPQRQGGQGIGTFVIRATLPSPLAAGLVRRMLHEVAPAVPVVAITSLADQVDGSIASERLLADIAAFFGLMALLLVAVGVYGTLTSSLAQRTRELGVRRALGASNGQLAGMILARALTPVGLGLVLGMPAALVSARLAESILFGVTSRDPLAYVAGAGALAVVAIVATVVPARSAIRTSVTSALRQE